MRILFLTPNLPFPAHSGGSIKSATLLAHLKDRHDVDVLALDELRGRTLANLLRSFAAGVPLSILRNRSQSFAFRVTRRSAERGYDAVLVDGWLMAQYAPKDFDGLRMLHEHNAEHVMWRRQVELEPSRLRRALVRMEAGRVRRYESSILRQFDVIFAVSEDDRRALRQMSEGTARVEILPNLPEPGLLERAELSPSAGGSVCLFLGTLSWPPNLQGLRWFIEEVLPLLRSRLPAAKLVIGGRGAPPALAAMVNRVDGVEFVGPFDDPEPLYLGARVFVEVSRGGSGTRIKVLNALARGLPVVTTRDGAEGLGICPGEHALVASTPGEFADSVTGVLSDDAVWKALAENGRRLIRERFTPERAYRALDDVLAAHPR